MNEILAVTLQSMHLDMARLDGVAANLANARTTAYKREVAATFAGHLAGAQDMGAAPASGAPQVASVIHVDARPGTLQPTGRALDLAITGPAWFEVSTDQGVAYTRRGDFRLDAQGRLVTAQGKTVLGVGGEIQLNAGVPFIDAQGRVFESVPGERGAGKPAGEPLGQLRLVQFAGGARLERLGDGLFSITGDARPVESSVEIRQGFLENSNVDATREMVQLMQTMRHFESVQKALVGYDEMLAGAIRRLGEAA
jgi:flagellar basal-body rod protein FlgG